MTGVIPWWGYVVGVFLVNAALLVGMWVGWGRGWANCEEEQRWEREQAAARAVRPVYRVRPPELAPAPVHHDWPGRAEVIRGLETRGYSFEAAAEDQAHEAWLAHEEQALAVANAEPDPRTDSQWTADEVAKLWDHINGLLNDHPATEEL